jgi:hypothetical protein
LSLRDNQTISRQKALALSLRRDNDHIAATAKMAVLIVAAFPSRLSRYTRSAEVLNSALANLRKAVGLSDLDLGLFCR